MSESRTVTDAKAHLSAIVDEVNRTHQRVTLTVQSKAAAILIAPEDLAALEETIFWLSQPNIGEDIAQARRDQASGATLSEQQIRRQLGIPQ